MRVIALSHGEPNTFAGEAPNRTLDQVTRCELHAFEIENPMGMALVLAGGGYLKLVFEKEGIEVARWLNMLGYNAYVLAHRLPGQPDGDGGVHPADIALRDGLTAMTALSEWNLPFFLVGLSSGGHLAGTLACQETALDLRGTIIAYAPVNANHRDYKAPAGKPDFPPPEKQAFYNAWPIGIAAEPHGVPKCPVFLAYALHDTAVPVEHALNFIKTARDLNLDLDAHIFGLAPHGFALRDLDGSQAAWPDFAAAWLERKRG
ncbi:pectin acetylesterase [Asticcacaulis biprosthecium C19]|uniref:Pectin acetylesterase n=1 Tax=Asticcacaulis biprosthecium C19 TaxID=715226 RepID=F4QLN5_9CAUL|nr:prolyl oligopeptidase family serine peptidase [Asticcacaulis biprosthecium]EGF93533.1 pectin acetylesterase [Asticcacaulis biprosthecium C19]